MYRYTKTVVSISHPLINKLNKFDYFLEYRRRDVYLVKALSSLTTFQLFV